MFRRSCPGITICRGRLWRGRREPAMSATQPRTMRRRVLQVLAVIPAVLITAWWVRSYFMTDWWILQRPPQQATGTPGEIRGVRSQKGTFSYWLITADPPAPGAWRNPFSPLESSLTNDRTGWFWDTE